VYLFYILIEVFLSLRVCKSFS